VARAASSTSGVLTTAGFFAVAFTFFGAIHPGKFGISGDSLCQIAYGKILFHPGLAGSVGASQTKPAQVLLLGITHEMGAFAPWAAAAALRISLD